MSRGMKIGLVIGVLALAAGGGIAYAVNEEEERRHRGPDGAGEPPRPGQRRHRERQDRAADLGRHLRRHHRPHHPHRRGGGRSGDARASSCSRSTPRSTRRRSPGPRAWSPRPRPPCSRPGPTATRRSGPGSGRTSSRSWGRTSSRRPPPKQARTALDVAEATYQATRAQLDQSRASLQEAKDNLAKTRLVSPIAGRVVRLAVEEGEVAVPGHVLPGDRPADDHRRPLGHPGEGAGGRDRRRPAHPRAIRSR